MLDGCTEEHRKRIKPKDLWRQLKDPVTALDGMEEGPSTQTEMSARQICLSHAGTREPNLSHRASILTQNVCGEYFREIHEFFFLRKFPAIR